MTALLASLPFYLWHHTSADKCRDKKFVGLLPFWDILSELIVYRRSSLRDLVRPVPCR